MMASITIKLGLLALAIGLAASHTLINNPEWLQFKVTHGKIYKNEYEETMRHAIFIANLKKIEEHNRSFQKGLKTYSLKMNRFADLTPQEFKTMLKGLKSESRPDTGVIARSFHSSSLPDSIDWRQKGAVTPVKDQGQCGSCWAFSATGALEGQLFIHNATLASLSEQDLIDCAGSAGNEGCSGGWPDWAFNYISQQGIDTEESYPYEAVDDQCRFKKESAVLAHVKSAKVPEHESDLQAAVANIGPISICIDAGNDSFMFYGSGVYYESACSTETLDHAVLIVGYGSDNGNDYWIVKNSWAASWGEAGYIRMSRNKNNNCGVATHATYPII